MMPPAPAAHLADQAPETPSSKRKVAAVINFLPDYRTDLYRRLLARNDLELTLFCHVPPAGGRLKVVHEQFAAHVRLTPARFFGGERLVWSHLPWRELLTRYDTVFVEGNPRYLAFALLATALRVLRRPVVLWTMVHSFRNNPQRQWLRLAWTRCFPRILVYTETEAEHLIKLGFQRSRVVSINNGLDQGRIAGATARWPASALTAWQAEHGLTGRRLVLSCARFEPKNKFLQVVDVLPALVKRCPDVLWCVIGEGAQGEQLRQAVLARGLQDHVRWIGALHDEAMLAPWFLSASMLVHPGAIGLTILHAFGYGLPVVTHRNAQTHCPEFVAFTEGSTGLTFPEDDLEALERAALSLLEDQSLRHHMRSRCLDVAENRYNTRMMAERFAQCLT